MIPPPSSVKSEPARCGWANRLARKALSLVVAGIVLGWAYQWAAVRFYQAEQKAGFRQGIMHGALMPAALPSLLLGKDVPIFAANNTGRTYKLGYIAGINACGLIFFGLAFRNPKSNTNPEP
jgi:hypothetical protein